VTQYALDASFNFTTTDPSDPTMNDWLERVSDHLAELDTKDVSIVSETSSGGFTVSLVVEAPEGEFHTVVQRGLDLLRTAFHACGGGTPEWPMPHEALGGVKIALVESTQRVLESA